MPPRVSITKLQRETAIATDLLDLCTAITEDGHLDDSEVEALRAWLGENRDQPLPAIAYLTETVERILADGRVTPDEHRDLYQAIEKVLPPDLRAEVRGTRVAIEEADRERSREAKAQAKAEAAEARVRNLPIERYDFMVAGVGYDERHLIVEVFAEVGEPVELVREPGNRYSRNAVRVELVGQQIGYVPEELATEMAPLLDNKHQHRARIKKVLEGRRYPIPVVIAEIFKPEAELPPLVVPPARDEPPEGVVAIEQTPVFDTQFGSAWQNPQVGGQELGSAWQDSQAKGQEPVKPMSPLQRWLFYLILFSPFVIALGMLVWLRL